MANCSKCGSAIEYGSLFCKNCGQKFTHVRRARRAVHKPSAPKSIKKKKSLKIERVISGLLVIMIFVVVTVIIIAQLKQYDKKSNISKVSKTFDSSSAVPDSTPEITQSKGTDNTTVILNDYNRTIRYYNKVIALNPQNPAAYYNRGIAYINNGNYEQAIEDLTKSIELSPQANAYVGRGFVYDRLSNYNQAIADYDKAIEIDPQYGLAYTNRGNVYYELGKRKEAIVDLKEGARLGDKETQDWLKKHGIAW